MTSVNYPLFSGWIQLGSPGQTVIVQNIGVVDVEYQLTNTLPSLLNNELLLYVGQSITLNLSTGLYFVCLGDGLAELEVTTATGITSVGWNDNATWNDTSVWNDAA